MKKFAAPLLLAALLSATGCTATPSPSIPAPNPPAPNAPANPEPPCQTAEAISVDTEYIGFASMTYRYKFYQFGRSVTNTIFGIEDRYTGTALAALQRQTANWPESVSVSLPGIYISSRTFNADCNEVRLKVNETWQVRSSDGAILFEENNQPHDVTMVRADGLLGEKWVVSHISGL